MNKQVTVDRELLERAIYPAVEMGMDNLSKELRAALAQQKQALSDKCAYPEVCPEHVHEFYESTRPPAQPEQAGAVAWSVLDKRTGRHWFTHESPNTAQHYANEYSHRQPNGSPSMVVKPLYANPPAQPPSEPRKPLTDEQIADLHRDAYTTGKAFTTLEVYTYFAKAIEHAHSIGIPPSEGL